MSVHASNKFLRIAVLRSYLSNPGPYKFKAKIETDFGYSVEGYPIRIENGPPPWQDLTGEELFVRLVEEKNLPWQGGISEMIEIETIKSIECWPLP